MKQNKICKSIALKSKHQLQLFQKRQTSQIEGTLKIILGKNINEVQDIWFEEYRNCQIQELRELYSNELAFEYASLISKACLKLKLQYGNFMLNENMVFKTGADEELFIWMNPDLFINQSRIFLPQTREGQLSMVKSLVNYFKLWLQTDYCSLSQVKTLQQLQFRISSQRNKNNSSNAANSTKVQSQGKGQNQRSNSASKNVDDKRSYKSKNIGRYNPSVKGSQTSQASKSLNNKIQFKHIFPRHNNGGISSKHSQSNFQKQDDFLQINHQKSSMSQTTGNPNSKYFPFKTTSANSKKILTLIRKADDNPDEYVSNNIKMCPQKLRQIGEKQMKRKMKQSLNEVGQELDNLFLSNMEEQEEDFQETNIREKLKYYKKGISPTLHKPLSCFHAPIFHFPPKNQFRMYYVLQFKLKYIQQLGNNHVRRR